MPEIGSYIAVSVAGESAVFLGAADGSLNAFYDVYQHRAHRLWEDAGRIGQIRCPYHSWTYALQGRLKSAPGAKGRLPCEDFPLQPVQIAEFAGFIFIIDNDNECYQCRGVHPYHPSRFANSLRGVAAPQEAQL